jgi:hypothetical protein
MSPTIHGRVDVWSPINSPNALLRESVRPTYNSLIVESIDGRAICMVIEAPARFIFAENTLVYLSS